MNPKVIHAQRACEAAKARQAVVVWFNEAGQYAVARAAERELAEEQKRLGEMDADNLRLRVENERLSAVILRHVNGIHDLDH